MSSNSNLKPPSTIFEQHVFNQIKEDNDHLIRPINNNEMYEKLRPLKRITDVVQEHQAHGDDTNLQISKDQEKPLELFSYENQQKSQIPAISSSSNEFSFEMAMETTETSNEALKTDDENGMTKSYLISHHQKEKKIILSDVSLPQPFSKDDCEYEIDLGNGYITKSISSYQKQPRTTSIISADSSQPITTFQIPFTSTVYKSDQATPVVQQQKRRFPLRTVITYSLGPTIVLFLIVLMFFVF